ncbi:MAG: hypothetical protein ACKO96_47165, partial [Flammeovirgaceae bacterium]
MNPNDGTYALQNLSFSVSSTKSFLINDTVKTDAMGFGFRTVFRLRTDSKKGDAKEKMMGDLIGNKLAPRNDIMKIANDLNGDNKVDTKAKFIKKLIAQLRNDGKLTQGDLLTFRKKLEDVLPSDVKKNFDQTRDLIKNAYDEVEKVDQLVRAIEELQKDETGLKVEIAGATSLNFPTNTTDYSIVPKTGFWITPSYQPANQNFQFLGVFRYFWYNQDFYEKYIPKQVSYDHSIDFGGRLVFKQD